MKAGDHINATRYKATAARLAKQLRARPSTTVPGGDWTADYGVHASSYLINAKLVGTAEEQAALVHDVTPVEPRAYLLDLVSLLHAGQEVADKLSDHLLVVAFQSVLDSASVG